MQNERPKRSVDNVVQAGAPPPVPLAADVIAHVHQFTDARDEHDDQKRQEPARMSAKRQCGEQVHRESHVDVQRVFRESGCTHDGKFDCLNGRGLHVTAHAQVDG